MTRHGAHTESRMRENCTYGSMRGIRRKTAKHVLRVAEGRAGVPHGASRSTLTPPLGTPSRSLKLLEALQLRRLGHPSHRHHWQIRSFPSTMERV